MKEKFIKWIPALALVSFVAAVFLIADIIGTGLHLSVPE